MSGYKPVLPSTLLSEQSKDKVDFGKQVFGNNTLKMGVVIELIEPEQEENKSKLGTEYHVMCIEQDGRQGISSSIYKNCLAMDSFGGIADFFQFKRRIPKDTKKVQDAGSSKEQEGTMVLLLCLDGNAEKAVIIGQMQNSSRKVNLNTESGHHGEGEFNGIRYSVDKDGAFTLTFKGATDEDGKPKDASVAGSQILIDKEGSVELNDAPVSAEYAGGNRKGAPEGTAGEGGKEIKNEKFRIDRKAMTILAEARKSISANTEDEINLTSKKNTNITCKDLIAKCEGKAEVTVGGTFDVKADGAMTVKAASAKINLDGAAKVQCSAFSLSSQTIALGNGGTPAVILTTKFLGTGNLGAPVVCNAIGPFSSVVTVAP